MLAATSTGPTRNFAKGSSFLISSLADPMVLFVFFVPFVAIELQTPNGFQCHLIVGRGHGSASAEKTLDAYFGRLLRFDHWSQGARIRAEREAGAIPARSRHCDQRARRRSRPLLLQAMGRLPAGRLSCQSGDLPWDRRGTLRTRAARSNMHTGFPHLPSCQFSSVRLSPAALPAKIEPEVRARRIRPMTIHYWMRPEHPGKRGEIPPLPEPALLTGSLRSGPK